MTNCKDMKSFFTKLIALTAIILAMCVVNMVWVDAVQPVVNKEAAIATVNGGEMEWASSNMLNKHKDITYTVEILLIAVAAFALFFPRKNNKAAGTVLALMGLFLVTGCSKYDVPEYADIGTSETAFVLPLEGATGNQAKFDSAKYLEERKVAAKRIQIPHRWNKTGRGLQGDWIPTVKVVKVDRSPVTCEWKAADGKKKQNDNAIWIESADSVGFAMGWSVTAYIKEEDASQFLYMYPSGSLSSVMNSEIRARVQQGAAEIAAKYKLDDLRNKKNELTDFIRKDIVPFFATRGITVTTLGNFGGMSYENDEIQRAIDNTFIVQQEKVNSKSMLEAQNDKNLRIKQEADALAEAARTKAKGEADGRLSIAQAEATGNLAKQKAEAEGIELVNKAIEKANNNPLLVQLKQIEVDKIRATTWDGKYPSTVVGQGANMWVGLPDKSAAASSVK